VFDFQIRHAAQHDFATVVRFVHAMLGEMYALSSKALSDQGEAWQEFETRILQTLSCAEDGSSRYPCAADHLLEIAEMIGGDDPPRAASAVGLIEASILYPTPIFRPAQTLCINSLYVLPKYRRRGIGTALLCTAIDWGRHHGCLQAQLSVLPHNPARRLYRELGFSVFGLEMHKEMTSIS